MLSPNARKLVFVSLGSGGVTSTGNEQDPACPFDAVAVHCTVVDPTAKLDPDAGVQLTLTGATPPVGVGTVNVTGTAAPLGDGVATGPGHVTEGADGLVGRVGDVGLDDPPHAPVTSAASSSVPGTSRRRPLSLGEDWLISNKP